MLILKKNFKDSDHTFLKWQNFKGNYFCLILNNVDFQTNFFDEKMMGKKNKSFQQKK